MREHYFFINELNVALLLVYGIRFSIKSDNKLNALLCYTGIRLYIYVNLSI